MAYQFLAVSEEELREALGSFNEYEDLLKRLADKPAMGTDIVGMTVARKQALLDVIGAHIRADRLMFAPAETVIDIAGMGDGKGAVGFGAEMNMGTDDPVRLKVSAPIAYDVWYLAKAGNTLKFGDVSVDDGLDSLSDFLGVYSGIVPLDQPIDDVLPSAGAGDTPSVRPLTKTEPGPKEPTVKEARYELYRSDTGSAVNPGVDGFSGGIGYIAFPCGPFGVMWKITITTESAVKSPVAGSVHPALPPEVGDALVPPYATGSSSLDIPGELLVDKAYKIVSDNVEYPSAGFGDEDPQIKIQTWLRYWIPEDSTLIVPGEFVALLAKPWLLHAWWHNVNAPKLFAGHWVETAYYTSGVIIEIVEEGDYAAAYRGEVGARYKVRVKTETIWCKSSDFLEYEEGERVGLLKKWDGGNPSFSFEDLKNLGTGDTLTREWVIVPVDFYGDGSTSKMKPYIQ
ncbi:MAG: hypothetical protein JRI80_04870 [Deltaproteobacteria bacterium]|nr:hypothetical protein [Deltaproteobacteria bacterium]